jgi:hypothetical protein
LPRSTKHKRWTSAAAGGESGDATEEGKRSALARQRWFIAGAGVFVVLLVTLGSVASCAVLSSGSDAPEGPPKAVIVDQLSLTFPNQQFVDEATATLERSGHTVDYFAGEQVNVELFRQLATHGYDVLVLRAHSARIQGVFQGRELDEAVIFTNEPYSDREYLPEQRAARLDIAYTHEGAPEYFGITADFVELSMGGNFDGATVIMMGCEGLASDRTAEAFVEKGADSYVSWSDTVSASHTDAATERLLEYIAAEGQTADDAVARVMEEIGADPAYNSELRAYPADPEG